MGLEQACAAVIDAWERGTLAPGGLSEELGTLRVVLWRRGVYRGIIPDDVMQTFSEGTRRVIVPGVDDSTVEGGDDGGGP